MTRDCWRVVPAWLFPLWLVQRGGDWFVHRVVYPLGDWLHFHGLLLVPEGAYLGRWAALSYLWFMPKGRRRDPWFVEQMNREVYRRQQAVSDAYERGKRDGVAEVWRQLDEAYQKRWPGSGSLLAELSKPVPARELVD